MKEEWKDFLEHEAGAVIKNGLVLHYGNPEREKRIALSGNTFMDLSHLGLISVHGEDAEPFLQNLFCNDIRNVSSKQSQYSALCSPKGRIIANFLILKRDDSYYLQLPASMLEPVIKRLNMFKLRSKVEIVDASDSFVRLGCSGNEVAEFLTLAKGSLPNNPMESCQINGLTIIRLPGVVPRFAVICELEQGKKAWQQLDVNAAPVASQQWQLLDILAGIPNIYPETTEAFVPQTANFKEIGGLSFTKGCYPGQEVVARSQYLGKLKRRMYLGHLEGACTVKAGDEVFGGNQQAVGKIVDCQPSPDEGCNLLAVLLIEAAENSVLVVGESETTPLEINKLPYGWADE